jgi:hypothetical protein
MARKRITGNCETLLPVQKLRDYLTVISLVIVIAGTFYNTYIKPFSDITNIKSDLRLMSLQISTLADNMNDVQDELKRIRKYQ